MTKKTAGVILFLILAFLACTQVVTLDGVPSSVEDEGQRGRISSPVLVSGG